LGTARHCLGFSTIVALLFTPTPRLVSAPSPTIRFGSHPNLRWRGSHDRSRARYSSRFFFVGLSRLPAPVPIVPPHSIVPPRFRRQPPFSSQRWHGPAPPGGPTRAQVLQATKKTSHLSSLSKPDGVLAFQEEILRIHTHVWLGGGGAPPRATGGGPLPRGTSLPPRHLLIVHPLLLPPAQPSYLPKVMRSRAPGQQFNFSKVMYMGVCNIPPA
jgi:hypothetical protein